MVRQILLEAYDLGMNNGEYSFLGIELIKNKRSSGGLYNKNHSDHTSDRSSSVGPDFSWYVQGDRRNKQAREMFESLMMISVRVPVSSEYSSFVHEVTKRARDEFGTGLITDADVTTNYRNCCNMSNWQLLCSMSHFEQLLAFVKFLGCL